jgi:hypothetical protein
MLLVFAHNLRQQVRAGRDRAQFAARDMRGRFITAVAAPARRQRDQRGR